MIEIVGCPNEICSELAPAIEIINLFHEGIPPIAGGSLDQTPSFLEAARQLKQDELIFKNQ